MCVLGCGGVLYGDHGSFASPNYPGTYPNSSHCEWAIRAPRGRLLTVTFAQIYIDDPGSCQNNYLKLYDSPDASGQPVGPYCGPVGGVGSWNQAELGDVHLLYFSALCSGKQHGSVHGLLS